MPALSAPEVTLVFATGESLFSRRAFVIIVFDFNPASHRVGETGSLACRLGVDQKSDLFHLGTARGGSINVLSAFRDFEMHPPERRAIVTKNRLLAFAKALVHVYPPTGAAQGFALL